MLTAEKADAEKNSAPTNKRECDLDSTDSNNSIQQMDAPFFSPQNHSFNVGIAFATKSMNAAVIFNHLIFWLEINKANGVNYIEGRTWMYETIPSIAKKLPYLSEQQIKDGLNILLKHNYIVKDNHSKNKFEKTNWYAVWDEDWLQIQKMFSKRSRDPIGGVAGPDGKSPQTSSYNDKDIKERYRKENKEEDKTQGSPPPLSTLKNKKNESSTVKTISYGSFVVLKEGEYESLCKQLGQELTNYYIEAINNYVPNNSAYKDYAATIRSWHLRDKAKGSLPSVQNITAVLEPVEIKIDKNRRVCEAAEAKLKHLFGSYVYFVAGPNKATLVDYNKHVEKDYIYEKIDNKILKELLLSDLESAFKGARDLLLGNKKII